MVLYFSFKKHKAIAYRRSFFLKASFITVKMVLMFTVLTMAQQDSLVETRRKTKFLALPAVAYSPENGFLAGGLGSVFYDLAKGDSLSRMSSLAFIGMITTKKQLILGLRWNAYMPQERYIMDGEIAYRNDVDRHYGIGNNADMIVHDITTLSNGDVRISNTKNYLDFRLKRISLKANFYRKIKRKVYVGALLHAEHSFDFNLFEGQSFEPTSEVTYVPVQSTIIGAGLGLVFDTRKTSDNPLYGTYLQLKTLVYNDLIGSEYDYNVWTLDLRHYWNTWKKHTFALRFVSDQRYHTHEALPVYSMPTIGGKEFLRGYYEGTYRDNHLLAMEVEYRLPLWQDENSSIWRFWRRLGMTAFASAAKVYPSWEQLSFDDIRVTIGIGGRYALDFEQRINLRIDIGYGLDKEADYNGRQWGFYFFISEAF